MLKGKSSGLAEFPGERQSIMRNSYASYPVELPVHYETCGGNHIAGQGRTLTISRETLRFTCDRPLPLNEGIRLVIAWPAALADGTGLNLWIQGTIRHYAPDGVEVRVVKYEFKTRPAAQRANAPQGKRAATFRAVMAG